MCMSELKKDYGWIEHESVYLACEDSPQCAFFGLYLVLFLSSWLLLYIDFVVFIFSMLPTVGCIQHSTPQNTYVAEDQLPQSSASSIVKKRRSSLPSTSLVPRPHPKNQERGLVTLANYLICVTITCLLWSRASQLPLMMALQSR